jgi:hypothetical protein
LGKEIDLSRSKPDFFIGGVLSSTSRYHNVKFEPIYRFLISLSVDFRFIKAFCLLPQAARLKCLDCFAPSEKEVKNSRSLSEVLVAAKAARNCRWSKKIKTNDLFKIVLIKSCNAHRYYHGSSVDFPSVDALFYLGSKMRHSCAANVIYSSRKSEDGMGRFVAQVDIAKVKIFYKNSEINFSVCENLG